MTERPQNVIRRVIDGKEYSCKKLAYRQARPLQMKLASVLAPLLSLAQSSGDMDISDAIPLLAGQLGAEGADLIIELCETCMVDGHRVNVDTFNADEPTDLKVAALALEVHFANFIKGLVAASGDLIPKAKATKS